MSEMKPLTISEIQTVEVEDETYWRRGDADGSGAR